MRSYAFTPLTSMVEFERVNMAGETEWYFPTAIRIARDDGFTCFIPSGHEILEDIPYGPMLLAEECDQMAERLKGVQ